MGKPQGEESIVLEYLSRQNRPFSVQQILDALQTSNVKKTACERALSALVDAGEVSLKEFGKAKVYTVRQDKISLPDEEEGARLDEQLQSAGDRLAALTEGHAQLATRLAALKACMSVEDMRKRCAQLRDSLELTQRRISQLDGVEVIDRDERQRIELAYVLNKEQWRKRKRMVYGALNMIGEGTGKKTQQLVEELGLETDEDAGVDMAALPDVPDPRKARGRTPVKRARE